MQEKRIAKMRVRFHVIGHEFFRRLIVRDRFVDLPLSQQSISQAYVGLRVIWSDLQRSLAVNDRVISLAFFEQRDTQIIMRHETIRIFFQSGTVKSDRIGIGA